MVQIPSRGQINHQTMSIKKNRIFKELTALQEALPFSDNLTFKFKADPDHDKFVIDWFIDCGEIRAYKYTPKKYGIYLAKGRVTLHLGIIWKNSQTLQEALPFYEKSKNWNWVENYASYFWKYNKKIVYCTNNLLKSPEEIVSRPGITKVNEDTHKYPDGSFKKGNTFHLSKDTAKTIEKSKKELVEILNTYL